MWIALSWVYGVFAGLCVLRYGAPNGLDLRHGTWAQPDLRPRALVLILLGPLCAWVVSRLEPRSRTRVCDAHIAVAVGLIVAALVRWTCLEDIATLHTFDGRVGTLRALASAGFAGIVGWLALPESQRAGWRERVHAIAALGGTAGVLMLQRALPPFIYGSVF